MTQNNYDKFVNVVFESFNGTIWERLPKTKCDSFTQLKFGVDSFTQLKFGMVPGKYMLK